MGLFVESMKNVIWENLQRKHIYIFTMKERKKEKKKIFFFIRKFVKKKFSLSRELELETEW